MATARAAIPAIRAVSLCLTHKQRHALGREEDQGRQDDHRPADGPDDLAHEDVKPEVEGPRKADDRQLQQDDPQADDGGRSHAGHERIALRAVHGVDREP